MKAAASIIVLIALSLCLPPKAVCALPAPELLAFQSQDPHLGTWQREVSDSTGRTRIVLELRGNGTYTKSLDAYLKGQSFQATEEGTWTANGPLVRLSGDGSRPPSGHDLRNYQKLTSGAQTDSSAGAQDASWAIGTWVGGNGDTGAIYTVTLTLNANGSYHKTLSTDIGVGGSHSGTWTLKNTTVYLSGDGKWPPYSHDLSKFKKVD